jgi:hypothetical protein
MRHRGHQGSHPPDDGAGHGDFEVTRQLKRRKRTAKRAVSLRDLVAADRAEYGKSLERKRRSVPDWTPAEERVVERYARAVLKKKCGNAVLAVEPCRAELARAAKGARTALRTRKSVHHRLVAWAIKLGRVRLHVPWTPKEEVVLDRFVRAVAGGRIRTARGAGRTCAEALHRLHLRYPARFAGTPNRSEGSAHNMIWRRLVKLRSRWYNSRWTPSELALADRHARLLIAHRFPHVRAASKACREAINRMHARQARRRGIEHPVEVRTLAAVFNQVFTRVKELAPYQVPWRRWTAEEQRVAARWRRKYGQHKRGELTMNLRTIAALTQAELSRRGYYRGVQACVTEIVMNRREGLPGRSHKPAYETVKK